MKTYILKHEVYNSIDFPVGTIVRSLENDEENLRRNWPDTFEVMEGELTGERGTIAEGLQGWVVDNTPDNRRKFNNLTVKMKALHDEMQKVQDEWDSIEPSKL